MEKPKQDNKIVWVNEKRKIADLNPAPYNPRKMSSKQADDLTKSMDRFSLADPIVINKNNTIIGGHQRIRILKKKGTKEVDVRVPDRLLPEAEEKELNLRLNKNLGEFDWDELANFDLPVLKDIGFTDEELNLNLGLEQEAPQDAEPQMDKAAELNKKWKVKTGDLFQIGDHRLLCGDCTVKENIEKLMAGEKADMVFTDPPYGIGRDKGFGGFGGFGKPIARRQYPDDWDSERPSRECFAEILRVSKNAMIFGGNYFADLLPQGKHWVVWDKLNTMPTFGDCELIWTNIPRNSVKKITVQWNGLIGKEKDRFHPTQKPVGLLVEILKFYPKEQNILDPFGGSGTTLIACQNLKRKCRMMEISPDYCSVILERAKDAFGITGVRI